MVSHDASSSMRMISLSVTLIFLVIGLTVRGLADNGTHLCFLITTVGKYHCKFCSRFLKIN